MNLVVCLPPKAHRIGIESAGLQSNPVEPRICVCASPSPSLRNERKEHVRGSL
jgi:hypothetical protein